MTEETNEWQALGLVEPRQIHGHEVTPAGEQIAIYANDAPGAGGANHYYMIIPRDSWTSNIVFQNGPVGENGVNGVTEGALLAIVADRLRSFQSGPFSCRENALALTKIEEALHWLHHRTLDRTRRGVEGRNEK